MSNKPINQPIQMIAFDFDGTITTTDTLALFFRYWVGTPRWILNILKLSPVLIGYVLRIVPRDTVKAHLVRAFFKGADADELNRRAAQFAREVIPGLIRPAALKALSEKNKPPYTLYIVSASISNYLDIWAKDNGIERVIATDLEIKDGKLTGELLGPNCWGPGKMTKIEAEMAETPYVLAEAYGDTRGDREMLHAAQVSFFKPFHL
ncbi:MAG: HAD-IB family hydrolase [Robiginitomaculum sp.]|nr:HAD-IB family hydrolase [Robiginitomaculum sp.]